MSATYNLKDFDEYQDFFDTITEEINDENPVDGKGFPLDENDNPITIDWLWENYGQHLDGTQTVIEMAESDYKDAWECGHINPEDDCEPRILRESGLVTKQEQEVYTNKYDELCG